MFLFRWVAHGLWTLITLPFHLLAWLIKVFVIGPLVALVFLALLIFACLALLVPGSVRRIGAAVGAAIPVPHAISELSSRLQVPSGPAPAPAEVTCTVQAQNVLVQWSGQGSANGGTGGVQWYQVLRKSLQDTTWHRVALISVRDNATGRYAFKDSGLQHGATYMYAVISIAADGSESEKVVSHVQIVAP
jgi:hypothetical protein